MTVISFRDAQKRKHRDTRADGQFLQIMPYMHTFIFLRYENVDALLTIMHVLHHVLSPHMLFACSQLVKKITIALGIKMVITLRVVYAAGYKMYVHTFVR